MKRIAIFAILLSVMVPSAMRAGDKKKPPTPNVVIDVSAATINAAVQRPVDQTERVEEIIQDTPIEGIGRTKGLVWAELVPNTAQASIDVVFQGSVHSRTIGLRPAVWLHTHTATQFHVRRKIVIDKPGIQSLAGPRYADSTTTLLDVTNPDYADMGYLAIQFARRNFPRTKADAEAETAWKTARSVSDRLGDELTAPLESVSKSVRAVLKQIDRAGMPTEAMQFETTASSLQARLQIRVPGAGPIGEVPAMPAGTDLGIRIHQSLINEAARAGQGGRTSRIQDTSVLFDDATMGLLRDDGSWTLVILENLFAIVAIKPLTITLSTKDPLTLTFAEQGLGVDLHIDTIHHGDVAYSGIRVKAQYKIENTKSGVAAQRLGPVRLVADARDPDDKREALPAQFFFLGELLAAQVLKERFELNDLPVSDAFPNVRFQPSRGGTRDGWAGLAWTLAPKR